MNGSHARLAVSAAGFVSGGLHAPSRNSGQRHLGSGLAGVELIRPTPAGLNSTPPTALPRIENAFASRRRETLDTPILFSGCILATPRAKRKSSCPSMSDVSPNKNSPLMFVMSQEASRFLTRRRRSRTQCAFVSAAPRETTPARGSPNAAGCVVTNRGSYGRLRSWAPSGSTVASTRLAVLNLLLGRHDKAHEVGDAEGCRHRDVRGVAAAPHDDAADAGMVVTRVFRVPAPG